MPQNAPKPLKNMGFYRKKRDADKHRVKVLYLPCNQVVKALAFNGNVIVFTVKHNDGRLLFL